jgi:AraC-like DNA-binding protein
MSLPMPAAYSELVVRTFGTTPAARAALREGTGIGLSEPGAEIALGQQLQQVRNLNRIEPPGWGLRLGARLETSTHGPLGFGAVSAPTFADAITLIERFAHVRVPYFRFESHRDQRQLALRVHEHVELPPEERVPLVECLMLSLQKLGESILGEPMTDAALRFAWTPPSYAADYRAVFHGAVRFHARWTEMAFPAERLSLPCPFAHPVAYAESLRALEALDRRLEGDDYVAARVEQLLGASPDAGLSLAQAAERMRMSTRTLMRRLRGAGTTFQELLDAHRRERAITLLGHPDFDVAEVSHRLGYGDATNFGRAFRRWFGMAPGRYRRQELGVDPRRRRGST